MDQSTAYTLRDPYLPASAKLRIAITKLVHPYSTDKDIESHMNDPDISSFMDALEAYLSERESEGK